LVSPVSPLSRFEGRFWCPREFPGRRAAIAPARAQLPPRAAAAALNGCLSGVGGLPRPGSSQYRPLHREEELVFLPMVWLLKAVANQLVYVHHSINFVLYSLSGRRFRRELCLMLKGKRSRSPEV